MRRLAMDVLLALLVLAAIASVARIGMYGAFLLDDVPMIAAARAASWPSPAYLFAPWNGHVAPGSMLMLWFAARAFALSRAGYGALSALLFAVPVAWFALWTRRLLGPTRDAILVALFFCSSSAVLVACGMWCSVVTNGGPFALAGIVAGFAAITSSLAPSKSRGNQRLLAVAALSPLLFWDKAVLLPLGLFAAAVGWDGQPLQAAVRSAWRRWRRTWIACLALVPSWIALLAWSIAHREAPGLPVEFPSAARFVELISASLATGFPMSILGGPVAWIYFWQEGAPVGWQMWCARVALLALGMLCVLASRRSRLLLLLAVGWLAGSAALVVSFRAGWGERAVITVRYWSDSIPWFCLAAIAALLDMRSSCVSVESPTRRRAMDATCLVILSIAGLAWTRSIRHAWPDPTPNVVASIEALPEGTVVLDHPVAGIIGYMTGLNRATPVKISNLFAGTAAATRILDGSPDLVLLNGDSLGPFRASVDGPIRRIASCMDRVHPVLNIGAPRASGPLFLRVRGEAAEPVRVSASMNDAPGGQLRFGPDQRQSHTWVTASGSQLRLRLEDGARVCIQGLAIGPAKPVPPTSAGVPTG